MKLNIDSGSDGPDETILDNYYYIRSIMTNIELKFIRCNKKLDRDIYKSIYILNNNINLLDDSR